MTVAVTGAAGHVGGAVARLLAEAGVARRLLVRDPSRAPSLPGAEAVLAAYGDERTRAALAGVDTVLMGAAEGSAGRGGRHDGIRAGCADAVLMESAE